MSKASNGNDGKESHWVVLKALPNVCEALDNKLVSAVSFFIDNACAALNAGKVLAPAA
jgi:hypothetical protein